MIAKVFLSLAALLECLGLPYLLLTERYNGDWLGLIMLHLMIGVAVGLLGKESLPQKYRRSTGMVMVFFSSLALFIPILGAIGVLALVCLTNYFLVDKKKSAIQEVHENHFSGVGRPEILQNMSGNLQSRFATSSVQTEARLDALGKLQGFESHNINATVRGALQDHADDIRLVAFGILDQKEKIINAKINQELELYHRTDDEPQKLVHARQLAYAYWELIYKEVVEGDILSYSLDQALQYNHMVLATYPDDAGMWSLKGQISLRSGEVDVARSAFMKALEYGIPEARVMPYLAELAFRKKEFVELSALFHQSHSLSDISILHPILRYWDFQKCLTRECAPA